MLCSREHSPQIQVMGLPLDLDVCRSFSTDPRFWKAFQHPMKSQAVAVFSAIISSKIKGTKTDRKSGFLF